MLSLTFFASTTTLPTYAAGDLDLKIDFHNLNTQNSWFQPAVIRRATGRSYAWVVGGKVFFTKSSGKWDGIYSDAGGLLWYMSATTCHSYASPYIRGGRLGLGWAYIDPGVSGFKSLNGIDKKDLHYETYEFGNTTDS